MPTATARKSTTATPRKRRTRKATAKKVTSTPLNTTVETKSTVTETTDSIEIKLPAGTNLKKRPMNVEVDVKRRNISELNGLELVILPLVYLEGFVKLILKETGVTV